MENIDRMPNQKLAFIRSSILTAAIFAVVWVVQLTFGGSGVTPKVFFLNAVNMPVLPRFLDVLLAAPLGGLVGLIMANWKRLPEDWQRDRTQGQIADRIKTSLLLSGFSGVCIALMHAIGLDEPFYFLAPGIILLLLVISLICSIPKPHENMVFGSAGLLGLAFGTYAGMFPGVILGAMLIVVFVASISVARLTVAAARCVRFLFSWSCGL